ncbi:MAG: hypothetical protein M3541_00920 [Acidobacteriota bacterium]|nr:hypothetical protein [Acidobacteriota bacterium]MDQ3417346.1 hypothetical protein [Acidobacteriota bacterium]
MRDDIGGGRLHVATAAAVACLALGLYWPATSAWFFQDDLQWLAGTLTFKPGDLLAVNAQQHFYRPVISLYFWAATPLFGGSPVLFHWANNVLHAGNAVLVLLLASRIGLKLAFACMAAVFFLAMPAHIEATAWVSALAEPVTTFFGIIAVLGHLRRNGNGALLWRGISIAAFCLALMTHESAVVLLPLLVLADWAFLSTPSSASFLGRWMQRFWRFMPYFVALAIYLLVDLSVNSRSYLIEEGHYRFGLHAVPNLLGYVVTLYAGKRNLQSFIVVVVVLAALLLRGTPRVIFATAWLVLAILPFSFFTWSNTSRYAYMPAVGMALLITEGLSWLDAQLQRRVPRNVRLAISGLLGVFVAVRFVLFAAENIRNFTEGTERYRRFAIAARERDPQPAPGATLSADPDTVDQLHHRYLEALIQWEFKDPTLKLAARP